MWPVGDLMALGQSLKNDILLTRTLNSSFGDGAIAKYWVDLCSILFSFDLCGVYFYELNNLNHTADPFMADNNPYPRSQ